MRRELVVGALGAAMAMVGATASDASACGGCFHTPDQIPTVVTDHRMIFAISQQQTTLYDQIEYSGSPSNFAWVLPIHGPVTVGLSADSLFSVLDQKTQTTILPPQAPQCPFCGCGGGAHRGHIGEQRQQQRRQRVACRSSARRSSARTRPCSSSRPTPTRSTPG